MSTFLASIFFNGALVFGADKDYQYWPIHDQYWPIHRSLGASNERPQRQPDNAAVGQPFWPAYVSLGASKPQQQPQRKDEGSWLGQPFWPAYVSLGASKPQQQPQRKDEGSWLGQPFWPAYLTLGASKVGFKPAMHDGIAQSCWDLDLTCHGNCGANAVFPSCQDRGGSCTPYSFMPNIDNQDCSWMDDGYFSSQPFLQYSNEYSYQSFAAKKDDGSFYEDVWVLHGCDGAGIQTDCRGDIFYLEHFGNTAPVASQDCPLSVYGQTHERCPTFYHQGKGVSLSDYTCGWWRGYADAVGIEQASGDGVGAFGPAGTGGDYSNSMRNILGNCPSCANQSALDHPYKDTHAIAYFTGALWPWICNEDDEGFPYTGQKAKCYCDNEPSNGRQPDGWPAGIPFEPLFPQDTQIVYCGLYTDDAAGLKLVCDFITLDVNNNVAQADFRGVEMFPTSF